MEMVVLLDGNGDVQPVFSGWKWFFIGWKWRSNHFLVDVWWNNHLFNGWKCFFYWMEMAIFNHFLVDVWWSNHLFSGWKWFFIGWRWRSNHFLVDVWWNNHLFNGWKWWFSTISYVKIWFIIQLIANHLFQWMAIRSQVNFMGLNL